MQPAVQIFMNWFRQEHPFIYDHTLSRLGASSVTLSGLGRPAGGRVLSGLGDDTGAAPGTPADPATNGFLDTLKSIATPLLQTYQQQQLFEINLERAKNNLPPVTADQMAAGVGVNIGLSPATKKLVTYIGGGFLALKLFQALMRRRSA
jgi:hypothetical protein